jgi:hypothetical protein
MGKSNNRLGVTVRFNSSELQPLLAGMSILGIRNIKDYTKFAALKISDIVIQQRKQQEEAAANEKIQSNTEGSNETSTTTSDSGEQSTSAV